MSRPRREPSANARRRRLAAVLEGCSPNAAVMSRRAPVGRRRHRSGALRYAKAVAPAERASALLAR